MSNIGMIHEEQAANIGNFLVGRLLPFREKRSVGLLYLSTISNRYQQGKNRNSEAKLAGAKPGRFPQSTGR